MPGFAHHVTQRGNRGAVVFSDDEDRTTYLRMLRSYSIRRGVDVWAYCLMSNHVHLVMVPKEEASLSNVLHDAHTAYARYFNAKISETGHLWQGRFFSSVLEEDYLWAAVRYVERNPVRAGMVAAPHEYLWSSARAHCGFTKDSLLSDSFPPEGVVEDWACWLGAEDNVKTELVRRKTQTGRPCGSPAFVERLETVLSRRLRPQKPGPKGN